MEKIIERHKKLIALLAAALILLYLYNSGMLGSILSLVPGPERVDLSLYSVVANDGVNLEGTEVSLYLGTGEHSIIGKVQPNSWIAYSKAGIPQSLEFTAGYRWVKPDPKNPAIQAVFVSGKDTILKGITLSIRISPPSMDEVNKHGDPVGRNPTQIDWYSYETQIKEQGNTVTWKHYEVYVVPVDFIIELGINPAVDLSYGDFKNFDLWFVLDTTAWANAFTKDQYALLNATPPTGAKITAYNFRGGFPIWAWVGAWDPWVVKGRDNDPDKFYDPKDLSAQEYNELMQHLQIMPSYGGTEVTLYTQPGYIYQRLFSADIIKNPDILNKTLAENLGYLPDPRFATTVYFPITLINYGALKRSGGAWWNPFDPPWHKEYYPVSYMRVRVLYAIYGEWVYLWTKEEADKYNYQWENRSSTITGEKSWWDKFLGGIGAWFSNPFNILLLAFFGILIVLVILAIFAPGFLVSLTNLMHRRKEEGRGGDRSRSGRR